MGPRIYLHDMPERKGHVESRCYRDMVQLEIACGEMKVEKCARCIGRKGMKN